MYKIWEILKMKDEGVLNKGDKFKAKNIPFECIIEFDGCNFVYYNLMGNTLSRDTVSLCGGELTCNYEKVEIYCFKFYCPSCGRKHEFELSSDNNDKEIKMLCDCSKTIHLKLNKTLDLFAGEHIIIM